MLDRLCVAMVLVPLAGALIAGALRRRSSDVAAIVFALATFAVTARVVSQVLSMGGLPFVADLATYPWLPARGRLLGFFVDPLSSVMLLMITLIGFLVVLFSADYLGPKNAEHPVQDGKGTYYFWMLFFMASMVGIVSARNFFQLFIFWELTTLCSWQLIAFYREREESLFAGYKALIMTHLGGIFLMTAIVIVFVATRSFEFSALGKLAPATRNTVFLLMLVAAWAKAAQVPFYTWLPDAMEAPTPVSAYLHAAAMVKAGVYLVARLVVSTGYPVSLGLLVAVMAMLTIAVVVFLFFYQDDLKRLLALSTISHLGYIMLASGLGMWGSTTAFRGGLLHIAAHGCGKGLLFLSVGALAYFTGTRKMSDLSGAMTRLPLVAAAFFMGVFTVVGVPPMAGFWSKLMIIVGGFQLGGVAALLSVLLVVESMIVFGWFLWVGQKVFFGQPSAAVARVGTSAPAIEIALLVLMVLCVVIPLIVMPFIMLVG